MTYFADINHFENLFEAELIDNVDQKDLEVLQWKKDTIPRGLTPLKHLFDFNDVAKELRMEPIETDVEEHRQPSRTQDDQTIQHSPGPYKIVVHRAVQII